MQMMQIPAQQTNLDHAHSDSNMRTKLAMHAFEI